MRAGDDGVLKLGDFGLARTFGSPNARYSPQAVTHWCRLPPPADPPRPPLAHSCARERALAGWPLVPGRLLMLSESSLYALRRIVRDGARRVSIRRGAPRCSKIRLSLRTKEVGVVGTARWNFCWARSSTALRRTCQPPPSYYSHLPLPRTVEDVHSTNVWPAITAPRRKPRAT